ncbi:hypothetical protein FE257_001567 [Aspergillus nanangensis]|uniref:Uncharacterized protein n=1 Tax=Aspergillus nanangensis TaxID=2582783 RepID=A0AAD4CVC5_ASPNN|nr:hypothetical protein FE257_001567 [Aspergillus nanangensis]
MLGFLNNKTTDDLELAYRNCITTIRSLLPTKAVKHEDYELILQNLTNFQNEVDRLMTEKPLKDAGEYLFCGMYSPYIYPSGEVVRVAEVGRFVLLWSYVDDILDSTTDISLVTTICASLRKIVLEPFNLNTNYGSLNSEIYRILSEFLHGWDCDAEVASMIRSTYLQYIDHTLLYRATEIEGRTMWMSEYLMARSFNVSIPVVQTIRWSTNRELDAGALRDDDTKEVILASGRVVGLTLDMFNHNGEKPNKTIFVHPCHILEKSLSLSHDDALRKVGQLLDECQAQFSHKLQRVSAKFPQEAEAIAEVHFNSLRWVVDAGRRYKQKPSR